MRSWGAEGLTGAAPSMPPPTDGPDSDDVIPLTDGALKPPWGPEADQQIQKICSFRLQEHFDPVQMTG